MIFPQAFPLVAGTKRPAVKWSDPHTCRPTNGFGPEDVYGLPTGPRNGIWVLDIDRKDGKDGLAELNAYAAGRELPATYTVQTPSGGFHLYFSWDDNQPIGNRAGILPGLDARGAGGFVAAGGAYRVLDGHPPVTAPVWLLDLVGTREEKVPGVSAVAIDASHPEWNRRVEMAAAFIQGEPACISGQGGQQQLWKIALRLMRTYELPVHTALAMLDTYNTRCLPPWTEQEIVRTLERAAEHGQGPTGTFSPSSAFLAPERSAAPVTVPLAPSEEWRQRANPAHEYSFDLAASIAGGSDKTNPASPKELAACFTGPGASPAWVGVFQYDTFRRRTIAVNPPLRLEAESTGLTERDLARIRVWLACFGMKTTTEAISEAIDVATSCAEFHPVRDYLDALPSVDAKSAEAYFDGIAGRLWGATAERDALESGHLRRLAIAAVRRIRRPGTKVDNMLILAGSQGYRKSALCAHLFGDFFRDQMPALESRDASIALEGVWCVEMAEMTTWSRSGENLKKEFLTRCEDKYRPMFGKGTIVVPRQCVFIGTTNEDDFLTDPTGNTRYDVCEVLKPIDLSWSRDEFWAAANALEAAGESHFRDRAEASAEKSAEEARHSAEDPWTDAVLKYARAHKEGQVTAAQCLAYGVAISVDKQSKDHLRRVQNILRKAFGPARPAWVDERTQRVYVTRRD